MNFDNLNAGSIFILSFAGIIVSAVIWRAILEVNYFKRQAKAQTELLRLMALQAGCDPASVNALVNQE